MTNIVNDKAGGIAMRFGNLLSMITLATIIVSMVILQLIPDAVSMNTGAIVVWVMAGVYTVGELCLALICVWLMRHAGVDYAISPEFERKRKQLMQVMVFCIASIVPVILMYPASYWNYPLVTNGWQSATTAVYLTFVGHVIYWLLAAYWMFPRVLEGFQAGPRGFRSKTINMRPSSIVVHGSKEAEYLAERHANMQNV